jgi:integrase
VGKRFFDSFVIKKDANDMPLTDPKVDALKYDEGGKNKHPDYEGLLIDIRPPRRPGEPSNKVWRYRYRIAGKENVLTIGRFPDIGVDEARQKRNEARKLVAQGLSPNLVRKQEQIRQANDNRSTFEAIFREWVATRKWAPSTKRNRLAQIEFHVLPYLGPMLMKDITPLMVLDVLRRAETPATHTKDRGRGARTREVGSAGVARKLRQYIAGVFEVAIATGRAESNPAGSLRVVLTPAKQVAHKTPLTPTQTGALMRAIDAYRGDPRTVLAYRLLWWTLLRAGEVVAAHWDEFDLDAGTWTIPRSHMKTKKPELGDHVIPLSTQAVAELARWHTFTGGLGYLFTHRDDDDKPMVASSLAKAFERFKLDFHYSPHATRTTASTKLNEMGFRYDVIERQLDHEEPSAVRRAYNRATYFAERKAMLQQWADMLDAWRTGAKVIPLQQGNAAA